MRTRLCCVVCALAFFLVVGATASAASITLKAVHQNPPTHPYQLALEKFKTDVEA